MIFKNYRFSWIIVFLLVIGLVVFSAITLPNNIWAKTVSVTGTAKTVNTGNSYLDFTNYNSNVTIDNISGNFAGYGFLEDLGWVDFGSVDNSSGPVSIDLTSGIVTGRAKILNTGNSYLDFTNYNSNVIVNLTSGVFSGYAFSQDVGWLDFTDAGVVTSATLDAISPTFELIAPKENIYTNNERPSFKWKTATDATSSLSSTGYTLRADNGETGDFEITGIPSSRTTQYETNKYIAQYEGFDDDSADNNYISVFTKSSNEWGEDNNDGKLKEGRRTWEIKIKDGVGNERTLSRILFIDKTSPDVEISQINATNFANFLASADTTPTIFGKIKDNLSGDSNAEDLQTILDNKVASSPKEFEVRIERKSLSGLYSLHSLSSVALKTRYWVSNEAEITNNALQHPLGSDSGENGGKYSSFSYTPSETLTYGTYRVTISGKDKAGNSGNNKIFNITIDSYQNLYTPAEIEEVKTAIKAKEPEISPEELEEKTQEIIQKIVKPIEQPQVSILNKATSSLAQNGSNIYWNIINTLKYISKDVGSKTSNTVNFFGERLPTLNLPTMPGKQLASNIDSSWNESKPKSYLKNISMWLAMIGEMFFDENTTIIKNVQVAETGNGYVVITWETNHHTTNNKVNYGTDLTYGQDVITTKIGQFHELKIANLDPNTKYVFEVVSKGKNYVYDAHHEFTTPSN